MTALSRFLRSLAIPVAGFAAIFAPVAASAPPPDTKAAAAQPFYVLRPMDLIKVQVFAEPDLDRELRVSQDHTISMPLVGVVDVRNRTVRETEGLLTRLYGKDYLVNPQINITILEYAPRSVDVFGAVNTPGSVLIPLEKTFTLLDAIAHAGGFSRLANRSRVSLTRTLPDGQTENFLINADQLMAGDIARWSVHDGDVVYVPERVL